MRVGRMDGDAGGLSTNERFVAESEEAESAGEDGREVAAFG